MCQNQNLFLCASNASTEMTCLIRLLTNLSEVLVHILTTLLSWEQNKPPFYDVVILSVFSTCWKLVFCLDGKRCSSLQEQTSQSRVLWTLDSVTLVSGRAEGATSNCFIALCIDKNIPMLILLKTNSMFQLRRLHWPTSGSAENSYVVRHTLRCGHPGCRALLRNDVVVAGNSC